MAYERVQKSFGQSKSKKKHTPLVPPLVDYPTQATSQSSSKVKPYKIPSKEERDAIRRSLFEKWGNNATPSSVVDVRTHIQAKLTIGAPGDKYEQEADRVASLVVNQINAPVAQQESQNLQQKEMSEEDDLKIKSEVDTIQRYEIIEEEEELQMKPMVQLQPGASGMTATPDLETSIQQARSGGQPLADNIRQPMEQAFGADFSGVKVHTDAQADQLNQSIQAKAFTTGQDVFFGQGEYNPGSRGGQELLAHELTHVVQQNGDKVQGHQQETAKVSKKTGIIQRMNVAAQQHDGATRFENDHPESRHLVENITQGMSDEQIVNQLLQNFYGRQDFDYTGTYSQGWSNRGDCHTLVNEFIETAGYFNNIQMSHAQVNGPLFIQGGRRIIHNQQRTGNVDNGAHWRFDNHHTAIWNGTTIDVLFGRMSAMPAVQFQEGREAEFTIGGTTYYMANNATANEANTFTSNRNNRMDFSLLQAPRREIKTRFCCCTIM